MDTEQKQMYPRLAFLVAGIATTTLAFLVSFYWLDSWAWIFGKPCLAYDAQPQWLKQGGQIVAYSPWIVGALVLLACMRFGRVVRFVAFAIGSFLPYLALVGFLILGPVFRDQLNRTSFDSSAWCDPLLVHSDRPIRIRMVDDLLRDYDLHGRTLEDVEELLGLPDKTAYFSNWDLVYWLGPERGMFSIDSEWLVIRLDDNDQISEYRLVTD